MTRIAIDTNVMAYAGGVERNSTDQTKIASARKLLPSLAERHRLILSVQVLGELYNVLTKRGSVPRPIAAQRVAKLATDYEIVAIPVSVFDAALILARDHHLRIWDALILAAAADAGCALLLSEDMHNGFIWHGCTVANPFAAGLDPRLAAAVA